MLEGYLNLHFAFEIGTFYSTQVVIRDSRDSAEDGMFCVLKRMWRDLEGDELCVVAAPGRTKSRKSRSISRATGTL